MAQVTRQQMGAVLPFLERFEADGVSAGTWNSAPGQIPWFRFDNAVSEFQQVLYDSGWIDSSFDWSAWQELAEEFVETTGKIESADAETIQKLLTTHIRKERFCEGHLAAMFENGHIVALLKRMKGIRAAHAQ